MSRRRVLPVRRAEDVSEFPYRERLYACIHPETYKYFFHKDSIEGVWIVLEERYGPVLHNRPFRVIEIDSERFLFRSTVLKNPITVIRKRGCTTEHVAEFHTVIGFVEPSLRQ
jgi:hypothetical protein